MTNTPRTDAATFVALSGLSGVSIRLAVSADLAAQLETELKEMTNLYHTTAGQKDAWHNAYKEAARQADESMRGLLQARALLRLQSSLLNP